VGPWQSTRATAIPHQRPGDEIRHNNSGTLDIVLTDDYGSTVRTGEPISTD